MKGIVFTEFIEMVEKKFGDEMVDKLIEENDLPSKGIYTSVGMYDYAEMVTLLVDLSKRTEIPVPKLMYTFGEYLFQTFVDSYGYLFQDLPDTFTLLESIDQHIHVEVMKLYPEAELPSFKTQRIDDKTLKMIYHSKRKMADFAEGLMDASFVYFKEEATIERTKIEDDGATVHFLITKKN
ncbi:MAG: hypothetical protein ACI9LN_001986 [Saprospiraceae bacterium]|jgi:hypothetical protein